MTEQKDIFRQLADSKEGQHIQNCMQCGTCSGSCPLAAQMDHGPRELFALIREGDIEEALRSNTLWFCVSCYQCQARCPREIPVTDLFYTLKQLAVRHDLAPKSHKSLELYRAFAQVTERFGRVTEPLVMAGYSMKHPLAGLENVPLAWKLLRRGRLELLPQRTDSPSRLRSIARSGDKH
jgi:heterodisulfide reductase subunit C